MKFNISRVLKFLKENGLSPSTKKFLHTYKRGRDLSSALGAQAKDERESGLGSGHMLASLTRERSGASNKRVLDRLKTLAKDVPQTRATGKGPTGKRTRSMLNRARKNLIGAFNPQGEEEEK